MKSIPLFNSQNLRLTPVDPEKDAQVIAKWSYDLETASKLRGEQPARPMPAFEVKRVFDKWQKDADDNKQFMFAIRHNNSDEVMGVVRICYITWVHGAAFIDLILSDIQHWSAFGREALELALHYAFDELSLFRVTAVVAEYDEAAHDLYRQANFILEVRQRQALYRKDCTWDKLYYGMLRPEWKMQQQMEAAA